eukprot:3147445-Pyramimonas_sp.AAC.1
MQEAKLDPAVISYNAGISACEKSGQWQRALALFGEMCKAKLEPTVIYPLMPRTARANRASGGIER